jgi:parallel beta-helix repeat protein
MCRNFQNLNVRSLRILLLYAMSTFIVVVIVGLSSSPFSNIQSAYSVPCITYDSTTKVITVTCNSASLTDIDNQLNDNTILDKEEQQSNNGVWLLNAGIVVADKATLYINSTDTTWLKINADGDAANGIEVYGNLRIDSVKITSWNPKTNDYAKTDVDGTIPRPYIMVEGEATGTTDITNSELAYLGYEGDYKTPGLRYNGGDGSLLKGNHIHDLKTGFYSDGVGGIIIEDNHIHDNAVYGLDPHTGTHDMIIRNNVVHNNGEEGIICSLDCYNITIEGNEVYNNADSGIMFSINMYNSVARNNYVHDEAKGIFVSASHNNEIYNNTVSDSGDGIYLKAESSNNKIYHNTIINATSNGILVNTGASDNTFTSNTIINATDLGINVDEDSVNNKFENNNLINSKVAEVEEQQPSNTVGQSDEEDAAADEEDAAADEEDAAADEDEDEDDEE